MNDKTRLKMKNALIFRQKWLIKTNCIELIEWYTTVFSHTLKNAEKIAKNLVKIKNFSKYSRIEEDITSAKELDSTNYIRNLFKL